MAYGAILGQTNTTYTKDQILSSSDATLLGLSSTATPADMFNVLSHVGDLHVWRRTVGGVVDYPVSTNRNAYQEGNDAKSAGYTLGEVKNGSFKLIKEFGKIIYYSYGSKITVSDDGELQLVSEENVSVAADPSVAEVLKGKFFKATGSNYSDGNNPYGEFNKNVIYFMPSDATLSRIDDVSVVDKYQTVTGYPAIPASTTIEYFGNLGSKIAYVTGEYIGNGAYGASNPTVINVGFTPTKIEIYEYAVDRQSHKVSIQNNPQSGICIPYGVTNASYHPNYSFNSNGIELYCSAGAGYQYNYSGYKYMYIAWR